MRSIEAAIMKAIPQDKCLHVILGVLIFAIGHLVNWRVGIALVAVVGILKEVLDHFTGGDVSVWDVVATLTGGLIGLVCFAR